MQWWFKKFCKDNKSLEDEEHSGQPSEADNDQIRASLKLILLQLHEKLPKDSVVPILINKHVFEPSYNYLKFRFQNHCYFCTNLIFPGSIFVQKSKFPWCQLKSSGTWGKELLCWWKSQLQVNLGGQRGARVRICCKSKTYTLSGGAFCNLTEQLGLLNGKMYIEGYSPWDRKESDMTKQLSVHTHTHPLGYMISPGGK